MDIQILSILALIVAIAIGFFRNVNTGLLGISFAFFIGIFFAGMSANDIMKGFPLQLYLRLVGVSLLFFMAKDERHYGSHRRIYRARCPAGKNRLIPIFFFFANSILTALGPGPLPANSIMIPMGMAVARREKISDLLMGTMVASGALFGTLFPLSSTGIVAITLSEGVGVTRYFPIFCGLTIAAFIEGIILYAVLGGWKLKNHEVESRGEKIEITKEQKITVLVIALFVIGVLVMKYELYLMAFLASTVLAALGLVKQNEAIKSVPWGTFLMIAGVNMLITVIEFVGGIAMIADTLSSVMTPVTASPIMAVIGGLMSTVSSAVGVVMPTMIPTTAGIASEVGGVTTSALISAVITGSHLSAYSPMSGNGRFDYGECE